MTPSRQREIVFADGEEWRAVPLAEVLKDDRPSKLLPMEKLGNVTLEKYAELAEARPGRQAQKAHAEAVGQDRGPCPSLPRSQLRPRAQKRRAMATIERKRRCLIGSRTLPPIDLPGMGQRGRVACRTGAGDWLPIRIKTNSPGVEGEKARKACPRRSSR